MYKEDRSRVGEGGGYVDTSIVAKVHMSLAKILQEQAMPKAWGEAERHIQEALRLFRRCVGDRHPLTANAVGSLGQVMVLQDRLEEAGPFFREALELEGMKDAFHLETVFGLLSGVKHLHTTQGVHQETKVPSLPRLHAAYRPYVPVIEKAVDRARACMEPGREGDVGAMFKVSAECLLLAGCSGKAGPILQDAIHIFTNKVHNYDTAGLIRSCQMMAAYAHEQ